MGVVYLVFFGLIGDEGLGIGIGLCSCFVCLILKEEVYVRDDLCVGRLLCSVNMMIG